MDKEIGKVRNCLQFFSPILNDMKSKISQIIFVLFVISISSNVIAQTGWHTDPYPIQENIDILHYKFEFRIEDDTDLIKGKTTINFRITSPENKLFLDLVSVDTSGGMDVSKVIMDGESLNFKHQDIRLEIACPTS